MRSARNAQHSLHARAKKAPAKRGPVSRWQERPAGLATGSAIGAVVVGPDTDAAAVDAGDALDAARDFHGAIGFGLAVDIASQADDAVDGLDIEFQSEYVAGGGQVRLHLGGDPGVVDRLVGFALGHLAIVAFLGIGIGRGSR